MNHIQKIKPRVEQVCQELHLQYATEENEGRMYINLTGGPAIMPPRHGHGGQQHSYGQQQQPGGQYPQGQQYPSGSQYQQGGYQGQQQQYGGGQGQNNQNDEIEAAVGKCLPLILRKLDGCCIVM